MKARFLREMHHFILQHAMIEDGETVLVAVSGGADSLALLYGLHSLHTNLNCHLHVVHLDHGLRHDSATDANFVHEHATRLELPFTGHSVELPHLIKQWKLSVEAAGRKARYDFFESVCTQVGATKIALGHQQDDIAETVIMNLIRGAGATGLQGIKPIRDGKFIRPLVRFTRAEIEAYLKSEGIVPRQDSTNTDRRYLRNRIRHELIPLLEQKYNPNIKTGLSRTAEILRDESEYLDEITYALYDSCRLSFTQSTSIILDRDEFLKHHIILQKRILRHSITDLIGQISDYSYQHYQTMLGIVKSDKPNAVFTLPHGVKFRRAYQQLIFEKNPVETEDFAYTLSISGSIIIPELNAEITAILYDGRQGDLLSIPDGSFEAIFDYSKIKLPLTIRNRRDGDRFQPHGMRGTKKIKDFMMDAKVPLFERDRIPMLVCGKEILWVIGFTTNEKFKVHPTTQRYLHLYYARDNIES